MPEPSAPGGQSRWRLVLLDGPDSGRSFPITGETTTIGRELYNDIWLDDLHVSKNHARLTLREQQVVIEDLRSINGTRVNDVPISEATVLQEGDIIAVGSFTFKVERGPVELRQAQVQTRAYPVPPTQTTENRIPLLAGVIAGLLLIIVVLAGLGAYWLFSNPPQGVGQATLTPAPASGLPTVVVNQGPANDSQVELNRSVQVQATASDPSGITRMELWVNNRQVDAIISQLAQDVPSMTSAFEWTPDSPGTFTLDVRAYNQAGRVSMVNVATLTVPGEPDTPTPIPPDTPTPTITPLPPPPPTATFTPVPTATPVPVTPTPTPEPALYTVAIPALNVREGPGTGYGVIGRLEQGDQAVIVGQADIGQGQWWQIRFDPAPDNLGWVSAQPGLGTTSNSNQVPVVGAAPAPAASAATATAPPTPIPAPEEPVLEAPQGKTLLVVANRSIINQPARLTLSGGKTVGGGQEIDVAANSLVELVLEPDFYRALWSTPYRSFTRGADFTAVKGKVVVMWIVPEDGLTGTEVYDSYSPAARPTATPQPTSAVPTPAISGYNSAPPGKALLVVANRSLTNRFAVVTISGGSFGGGEQITVDANVEMPLEMQPGNYRMIWSAPGFTAGREFRAFRGDVILSWIIPEEERVFMQFPGQAPIQINN